MNIGDVSSSQDSTKMSAIMSRSGLFRPRERCAPTSFRRTVGQSTLDAVNPGIDRLTGTIELEGR